MLDLKKVLEKLQNTDPEIISQMVCDALDASGLEYTKGEGPFIFDSLLPEDNEFLQEDPVYNTIDYAHFHLSDLEISDHTVKATLNTLIAA